MKGYKLKMPLSLPKIVWACKSTVTHYRWENTNRANMMEFSVCQAKKRTVIEADGTQKTVEGKLFSCLMGDEKRQSFAEKGINVEILSVAVAIEGLSYEPARLSAADLNEKDLLLLPDTSLELAPHLLTQGETLLYQIIEAYKEHSAPATVQCAATVLALLAELDRAVRHSLQKKKEKFVHYYVDKAEAILVKRYHQPLSVQMVAQELSVTPNYLSALYKSAKGIGFCDRLLELRMKKAAQLLKEGLAPADAAAAVGYEDPGHFRRRFKQYFGISLRDFLLIEKELTLYHQKPQPPSEG